MPTDVDSNMIESLETDPTKSLKKSITIAGKAGYTLSLTNIGVSLANEKAGILSTCTISAVVDEKESNLASWSNSKTEFTVRASKCSCTAGDGKDIVLNIYLKTANKAYKAKATTISYTYDYVAVPNEKAFLVIECASQNEATQLSEKIKEIAPNAVIGIVAKV